MAVFDDDLNLNFNADDGDLDTVADPYYGGTEARIFIIDAHERMFKRADLEDEEERSCFTNAVNAVLVAVQRRVFDSNAALYAVILYGTRLTQNPNAFPSVYVLQPLDLVDPVRVKTLETLVREADVNFTDTYGFASTEASLGDALWMASHLFGGSRTRLGEKRVFLFSNSDDPHEHDAAARRKALSKAADLKELDVDLTVLPLVGASSEFDVTAFFTDLLQLREAEEVEALKRSVCSSWDDLETRLRGLEDKRRRLAALDFHLGAGEASLSFSVGLYSMVRERKEPTPLLRSIRDNKTEVKTVTRKFLGGDDGDGELLIPSDIKKGISYAGRNVFFEEDELKRMKDFGNPGIQLLGFKPRSCLRSYHHIGPSSFLYPDEAATEGSAKLFVALLRKCHLKDKVAIVRIIPRQNSAPTMAALFPQMERKGERGFQVMPPGFWVKPLPFADDFRDVSSVMPEAAEDDTLEDAREITDRIVKKLTFRFDPRNFDSPALNAMYNAIETMALDRADQPAMEDSTAPPNERIDQKVGALCEEWMKTAFPPGYVPKQQDVKKRFPPKDPDAVSAKPGRKKADKEVPSFDDMHKLVETRKLEKLTAVVMKQFCRDNNIKAKGQKKDDYVTAIRQYYGSL